MSGTATSQSVGWSEYSIDGVEQLTTKVLVVDDNAAYRRALRRVIEAAGSVVVGEAETGEDAIAMVRTLGPQVVFMDIHMPGIGGIEAARRIVALQPEASVVLMTVSLGDLGSEITETGLNCLRKEAIRPNTLRDVIAAARTPGHGRCSPMGDPSAPP